MCRRIQYGNVMHAHWSEGKSAHWHVGYGRSPLSCSERL
jgi:hypothetical protein